MESSGGVRLGFGFGKGNFKRNEKEIEIVWFFGV